MTNLPANSRPRTVLYVAASESAASDGAAALERVQSGPERSVHALTTDERIRNWAPEVDCVVFAETPTTAAGSALLEVVEACGSTPVVLFTDASFAPSAARSTDGIAGYVRRDTDDAVAHLADEIEWVCRGVETEQDAGTAADATAMAGGRESERPTPSDRFLASIPELVACRERERLFERLVETAADAFEHEYCWLSTVHFGEFVPRTTTSAVPADDLPPTPREGPLDESFRTGDPLRIDDLTADDRLSAPLEGVTSLCCVPIGDIGILEIAAEDANAFDERDCEALATACRVAAAILERIDDEERHRTERDRLRRERDRLADERDDLAAERDRYRTLFANVPEPAVRYEIDDGQPVVRNVNDTFTETFGTEPETVVGAPVDERTVPPGLEHRRATLLESLRAGERRQLVSRRETVDGVREFLLTLIPVRAGASDDGETADYNPEGLIVYSDVTETNRRKRELAAIEDRLETIADLVDEDVRTQLNVARGYLELAEETGDREHFAEVDDAQEQLRKLVDQLIAIAREDDALVETEPVAIHDVARRAWVAVETGDARLVTQTADDRVLEADKARLRELFEHLFGAVIDEPSKGSSAAENGGETGDDGDTTPVVTVGATDDGFYVARRNPDGDAAAVDGALETDPVPGRLAAADGTGFGLGPVERIADAHGWNVGVAEDDDRIAFAFRGTDAPEET